MHIRSLFIAAALSAAALSAQASQPAGFWSTPTIEGYGKIHYLSDGAYKPQADRTYKVVFLITQGPKSPDQINPGLDHVARTVNLYKAAGVPLNHLKFVAVAVGGGTSYALDNAHYQQAFGVPNPNLKLIAELRAAGVDVAVCAQAVGEHDYQYDWIDKSVTLALSGLTTVTTLQQQGYALMPM